MLDKLKEFLKTYEKDTPKKLDSIKRQAHDAKLKLLHQAHYELSQLMAAYRGDVKTGYRASLMHFEYKSPFFIGPAPEDETINFIKQLLSGKLDIERQEAGHLAQALLCLHCAYKAMGYKSYSGLRLHLDVATMRTLFLLAGAVKMLDKAGKQRDDGAAKSAGKIPNRSIKTEGQKIWKELCEKHPDKGPWTTAGLTLKKLQQRFPDEILPSQRCVYDWYR
jgi:hypothetical protein